MAMTNPFDPANPGTPEEKAAALETLGITVHEGGFTLGGDPCPTPGCPGDARYAAPGRGHLDECGYPASEGPDREALAKTLRAAYHDYPSVEGRSSESWLRAADAVLALLPTPPAPGDAPTAADWHALAATAYCRMHHPTHSVTCEEARDEAREWLAPRRENEPAVACECLECRTAVAYGNRAYRAGEPHSSHDDRC